MENIVECRNLTHYYGDKMVYEDLNFNIKKGSILGLLGKNGTGENDHHQYTEWLLNAP